MFGRPNGRQRTAIVALVLSALSGVYAVLALRSEFSLTIPLSGDAGHLLFAMLLVLFAAWSGYRRNGLVVSWLLTFGPVFGWFAVLLAAVTVSPSDFGGFAWLGEAFVATNLAWLVKAVVVAFLFSIILGTLGYLLGVGGRHLRQRRRIVPSSP